MKTPYGDIPVERKWLRLGIGIAILQYAFLVLVLALLRVDIMLALGVAAVLSIGGGIVLTVFVMYRY